MKSFYSYPKLLIVSRITWNDNSDSNTLTNLFEDYPSDKIARIYIESQFPRTKCCKKFYQISEISLIKKLFCWRLKTGRVVDVSLQNEEDYKEQNHDIFQEKKIFTFVRTHRSFIFTLLRELLWWGNSWQTSELKQFILDFSPDVIWLDGSPLILMNRLNNYVKRVSRKPSVTFLMDDVYCYKSCNNFLEKVYKFFLRKHVKITVKEAQHVFVASPKMKVEYDQIFNINSTFIAKSFKTGKNQCLQHVKHHRPIRLVYLGNVLIGRLETLINIAECLKELNKNGTILTLSIYTNTIVTEQCRKKLLIDDGINLLPSISFQKVPEVIQGYDVQVFVESLKEEKNSVARLSFSTKIVDYLSSGKCIFAVGPANIAPIEYFRNEDAAIVATSKDEIKECLQQICNHDIIMEYANKAIACGNRNHNREDMDSRIYSVLEKIAQI